MSITKADVIARFNAIVYSGIGPGTASAWMGNVPGSPSAGITNHGDLGNRAEANKTVADIPASAERGVHIANSVFHVLHNFAMEYTRVRQARWAYVSAGVINYGAYRLTALQPRFAIYFPIPQEPPLPGDVITLVDVDNFLTTLRNALNDRRTNAAYGHVYFACHSSCHASCHGSRGRR